jgi:YHS domain-containing protein
MAELVKDPVCKMSIEREKAVDQVLYQGQRYYFCSEPCAEQFGANPWQVRGRTEAGFLAGMWYVIRA